MSLDEGALGLHLPDEVLPHSQAGRAAAAAAAAGSAHYAAAVSPSSNSRKRKLPPIASLRTVAKWEDALEPLANTYPCTAAGLTCRSAGSRGACMILAIARQSIPVQHRQFEAMLLHKTGHPVPQLGRIHLERCSKVCDQEFRRSHGGVQTGLADSTAERARL
jgi:hypothetical protein